MKVAIIGAGMAGLSCADALAEAGHTVALFDKGRGPGGRMSTRRVDTPAGQASFDHGAQYFTVRDQGFAGVVADWSKAGVVQRWQEAGNDAWVGVPAMNTVVKHMAAKHSIEFGFLVKALIREGDSWRVVGESGSRSQFDAVVLALPAEQAAPILSLHDFAMARSAMFARSQPCWTAMFTFEHAVAQQANILKDVGPIAWAARNNAKPGRAKLECWVVQANATWSKGHLEHTPDVIAAALKQELELAIDAPLPHIIQSSVHRWRYALSTGMALNALWNNTLRLGACGDWLLGPRVECAWLSGQALAQQMTGAAGAAKPLGQLALAEAEAEAGAVS